MPVISGFSRHSCRGSGILYPVGVIGGSKCVETDKKEKVPDASGHIAAAPGALLSAVADNRINQLVFKAVLHVLVYTYMGLAAIVVERPGA